MFSDYRLDGIDTLADGNDRVAVPFLAGLQGVRARFLVTTTVPEQAALPL